MNCRCFLRVEFWAFGGNAIRVMLGGTMSGDKCSGLIDEERGVRAARLSGDFGQMQVHRFGVASGQDEGCAFAILGQIAPKI